MPPNKQTSPSNWYQHLEANRQFIIGALVLLSFALAAASALKNPNDFDGYWHLQMGKDLIENGLSPYKDHYSFTHNGHDISSSPVIFQVGLYNLVKWFGEWGGFVSIKLLAFFLTLGCMLAWLKQIKAPTLAYCIVFPLLSVLIELRSQVRPELFTYSLLIISLMLYKRTQLKLTFNAITPIALLLLFWSNYHSSILGYVIFFGLFVDIAFRLIQEKAKKNDWLIWAAWGVVLVAVGFLKPGMAHPAYEAIIFDSGWKTRIAEYRPPFIIYKGIFSLYILLAVALATLYMAARQKKLGYIISGGILLYAGLSMGRMVTPTGIIILGMLAHVSGDTQNTHTLRTQRNKFFFLSSPVLIAALVFPMYESVSNIRTMLKSNQSLTGLFPEKLIDHMRENNKSGRIINAYGMGGFLIHRLSPESQVYIDGRTNILYPLEHMKRWKEISLNADEMEKEILHYDIDFAILHSNARYARLMKSSGEMSLDFVDRQYALYSRKSASLPATGNLWAEPYCWTKEKTKTLEEEWETAQSNLPPTVSVIPFLWVVTQYANNENPEDWIIKNSDITNLNDESLRFIGYRAIEHGLNNIAFDKFNSILSSERKDYLAIALALLRSGKVTEAENFLSKPIKPDDPIVDFRDQIILQGLLTEIQMHKPLLPTGKALLTHITKLVGEDTLGNEHKPVTVKTFCDGI